MAENPERTPDFVIQNATRGRGRPRKDTPPNTDAPPAAPKVKTQATTAEVKQAMRVLESAYSAVSLGMTMLGLTESATVWAEQAATLSKSNEQTLTAAPKLAKSIAKAGQGGGSGAFILAHALAIAPVVPVVNRELANSPLRGALAKRAARLQEERESAPEPPQSFPEQPPAGATPAAPAYDPTLIPGTRTRAA